MRMDPADISGLKLAAENMVKNAGIDNYSFDRDMLVLCGVHYLFEACDCGDEGCDGVRLRRVGRLMGSTRIH